jgi:hypothetical protein
MADLNWRSALSSGAGLAAIGNTVFPGVGGIVGGALGAIGGLFSTSPEEERKRRKAELLARIAGLRQQRMEQITTDVKRVYGGAQAGARQAAASRAAAAGDMANVESYVVPAETNAGRQLSAASNEMMHRANSQFDDMEAQIEYDYAGRPIEPTIGEDLMVVGDTVARMKQTNELIEAINASNKTTQEPGKNNEGDQIRPIDRGPSTGASIVPDASTLYGPTNEDVTDSQRMSSLLRRKVTYDQF